VSATKEAYGGLAGSGSVRAVWRHASSSCRFPSGCLEARSSFTRCVVFCSPTVFGEQRDTTRLSKTLAAEGWVRCKDSGNVATNSESASTGRSKRSLKNTNRSIRPDVAFRNSQGSQRLDCPALRRPKMGNSHVCKRTVSAYGGQDPCASGATSGACNPFLDNPKTAMVLAWRGHGR
jgi:hypothetical protein